jgi:hypothetical protein
MSRVLYFICTGEREEIMLLTQHRSPRGDQESKKLPPTRSDRRAAGKIYPLRGMRSARKAGDEKPSRAQSQEGMQRN